MVNDDGVIPRDKRLLLIEFHARDIQVADLEFLLHFLSFFFQLEPLQLPLFLLGREQLFLLSLDFLSRRGLRRKLQMVVALDLLLLPG